MGTFEDRLRTAREANDVFEALRSTVESAVAGGVDTIDLASVAADAGIKVSKDDLARYGLPRRVIAHIFLPWHVWFPWEALWSAHVERAHPNTPGFVPGVIGKIGNQLKVPSMPMP